MVLDAAVGHTFLVCEPDGNYNEPGIGFMRHEKVLYQSVELRGVEIPFADTFRSEDVVCENYFFCHILSKF